MKGRNLKYLVAVVFLMGGLWLAEPSSLAERLWNFPMVATLCMLLILSANFLVVVFRYWRTLSHFGIRVPWQVAGRASIAGHVAGLFVWSIVGQLAGRQVVLGKRGVPVVVNSSIAIYERVVIAFASGFFCFCGAIWLFGGSIIESFSAQVSLLEIFAVGLLAVALSVRFGRSCFESDLLAKMSSARNAKRLFEVLLITLFGQFLVLTGFVIGTHALAPHLDISNALAAAAIISFAASLPVSVNGWGVRELVSVFILGKLGVPAPDALAISVMVGICSTVVVFLFVPLAGMRDDKERTVLLGIFDAGSMLDIERAAAWVVGIGVSVAIFFQAHFSLQWGVVNINFADPLAIIALTTVAVRSISIRKLPTWRFPEVNFALLLISIAIVVGFLNGWIEIGFTQWAFGGRLLGWLVLLGYLSAGLLIGDCFGRRGFRRFVETVAITVSIVVVVQGVMMATGQYSGGPFEGYASNRNAFAFQALVVLCFLLAYSSAYRRVLIVNGLTERGQVWIALFGLVSVGLVWTCSRTGWMVGVLIVLTAWLLRLGDRRLIVRGLTIATAMCCFVWLIVMELAEFHAAGSGMAQFGSGMPQFNFSSESSDMYRWHGYTNAITLWWKSPLIGAGLGAFIARSPEWFGFPMVVHSTALWILAEFGLFGILMFGTAFLIFVRHLVFVRSRMQVADRALLLLLICFSAFSLLHEVFYQRIFWLGMGVVLAGRVAGALQPLIAPDTRPVEGAAG